MTSSYRTAIALALSVFLASFACAHAQGTTSSGVPVPTDGLGLAASRPVITAAPSTAALGGTLAITTDRAATSFSLVRMSSVTHSLNVDQRRVPLTPAATSGTSYQFRLPADPGTLLPGPWMLFAMDANGVPSVAKVVRIQ